MNATIKFRMANKTVVMFKYHEKKKEKKQSDQRESLSAGPRREYIDI